MTTPTCLTEQNPRGGCIGSHSASCAYAHVDGELLLKAPATHHLHCGVTTEKPNGHACLNVCDHHARYGQDREGRQVSRFSDSKKERKLLPGFFLSPDPVVMPDAELPLRNRPSLKDTTAMSKYLAPAVPDQPLTNEGDSDMATKKTTKAKSGRGRKKAAPVESDDPVIQQLAAKQSKSAERLTAGTTVKLFRKISKATRAKPVVHKTLSLYDKRLARELARLNLVAKDTIEDVGLAYFPA